MPFDGSGNFVRLYDFEQDRDNGLNILASRVDGEFDNFANALSQVFLRSGALPFTGDLNLGLNRIIGIAAGTPASPGVRFGTDTTSGLFLPANGRVGIAAGGAEAASFAASAASVPGSFTAATLVGGTSVTAPFMNAYSSLGEAYAAATSPTSTIAMRALNGTGSGNAIDYSWATGGQGPLLIRNAQGEVARFDPFGSFRSNVNIRSVPSNAANPAFSAGGATPYFAFSNAADTARYGLIQHLGAGQAMLIQNDQGNVIRLNTAGIDVMTVGPSGVGVTGGLNVSANIIGQAGLAISGGATASGGLFVDPNAYLYKPNANLVDLAGDNGDLIRFDRTVNRWNWFIAGASYAGLDASVFSHNGTIAAGAGMTVGGNGVWHAGNFNPANYQPVGNYVVAGTGTILSNLRVQPNASTNTGAVYFGNTDTLCFYDGMFFNFAINSVVVAKFNANEARFRGEIRGNLGTSI